ncbi:hypothetical protein DFH28DRAFT_1219668 [Melampsora americana]|nr:hypothetical protein DFH28DRAFT_1219668 [Melampsora americana]
MSNSSTHQFNSSNPHLLSLKVLRAARPTFKHHSSHPTLNSNFTSNSIINFKPNQIPSTLILPDSFGIIYLGQTFHALLSVQFDPTQSIDALTSINSLSIQSSLERNGLECAVKHQIKELGLHTLICTVTYDQLQSVQSQDLDSSNPTTRISRSFRKVYKFQVLNPFSVKTKVFVPSTHQTLNQTQILPSTLNAIFSPTLRHQLYLEVQIQNQSSQPIIFQHVKLIPPERESKPEEEEEEQEQERLEVVDLNLNSKTNCLPPSISHLSVGDSNQFLFQIIQSSLPSSNQSTQVLGRLDLSWFTQMGETGRLMTNGLTRTCLPSPISFTPNWKSENTSNKFNSFKLEITLEEINPSRIKVGIPFKVTYLIKLFNLPVDEDHSFSLILQDLSFEDRVIEPDPLQPIFPNQSSSTDWSFKDSLVSLSSTFLSNPIPSKRSSSLETQSLIRSDSNSSKLKSDRWRRDESLKAQSTPHPQNLKKKKAIDEMRLGSNGIIKLGSEEIEILRVGFENRISMEYVSLEDGLKS